MEFQCLFEIDFDVQDLCVRGKRPNAWTSSIKVATAEGKGLDRWPRLFVHLIFSCIRLAGYDHQDWPFLLRYRGGQDRGLNVLSMTVSILSSLSQPSIEIWHCPAKPGRT